MVTDSEWPRDTCYQGQPSSLYYIYLSYMLLRFVHCLPPFGVAIVFCGVLVVYTKDSAWFWQEPHVPVASV